jgi:hypothetical protein
MSGKAINVVVGDDHYLVHTLKAADAAMYFNSIASMRNLFEKLQMIIGRSVAPDSLVPQLKFDQSDFDQAGAIIGKMASLTDEQVANLDLVDWWALVKSALDLMGFMMPTTGKEAIAATSNGKASSDSEKSVVS